MVDPFFTAGVSIAAREGAKKVDGSQSPPLFFKIFAIATLLFAIAFAVFAAWKLMT